MSFVAQASLELGRLFHIQGKNRLAERYVKEAVDIFEQTDATVFLKQSRDLLASF
jgi:hypothetical protein